MKPYKRTFDTINNNNRNQPLLFSIFGILYFLRGMYFIVSEQSEFYLELFWMLLGLGFIILSAISKNKNDTFFIELNDDGIRGKLSFGKQINIKWKDVTSIYIKPISIHLLMKNEREEKISLENYSYKSVIEFKSKIEEFAKEFKVPIR